MLDRVFLERLAAKLASLPKPEDPSNREQRWMTAPQIAEWWRAETGTGVPDDLELALLEGWENGHFRDLGIRPAKYPSFELLRLWGHEKVVCPRDPAQIAQRRTTPPERREGPKCSTDGPLVFLSHSVLDIEFAVRVRNTLIEHGLRPWLAEEEIGEGELIFEAVHAALARSKATIVALGRNALGSAWVHTETVGSGIPLFVCDQTDDALIELLATWRPPRRADEVNYDEALLVPLVAAYRRAWSERSPVQAALEASVGGATVWRQRPDKFHVSATELLRALGAGQPCLHPRRPMSWRGDPVLQDFDVTIARRFST